MIEIGGQSFDLSDPFSPRLGGELEIPGFSTYMHPYDRDHLLTIGRGGDANGANRTMQLQLFDVSALDDPRLLHAFSPSLDGIDPADRTTTRSPAWWRKKAAAI